MVLRYCKIKHHPSPAFSQVDAVGGFSQVLQLVFTQKNSMYQPDFLNTVEQGMKNCYFRNDTGCYQMLASLEYKRPLLVQSVLGQAEHKNSLC